MKRSLYIGAAAVIFGASTPVASGPGGSCHFHGSKTATDAVVIDCATQRKDELITKGKLDRMWQSVKVEKAELVDSKKGKEWRVTFKDAAAKDKGKETLYMFFTAPGNFIAANFTGQ
ncbi:MAG TPA: DUF6488 family protein [Casimicrobiaceae bacterium]|nr:DUF6488 family protein [Casimicrobiaceae bacterium]